MGLRVKYAPVAPIIEATPTECGGSLSAITPSYKVYLLPSDALSSHPSFPCSVFVTRLRP